jgi:hypothetical protein
MKLRGPAGMTPAALVRLCIILSLPKKKAAEVIKAYPFQHAETSEALRKMLAD